MGKKAIIFDYNRTIYDPESDKLNDGIKKLLEQLKEKGVELFLISTGSEDRRKQIKSLDLTEFFKHIAVVTKKSKNVFEECTTQCKSGTQFFVVGDRVKKEIRFGNELGMKTIWFKQGKFSEELPENNYEQPDYTITSFEKVLEIIESC